ncbi:DUF1592 domain-containing protein [Phenylobacterium terrae]|uniref:DUF1592 domain-containing protein n=1 Tax=Phenylobacterium terrae TaxID=2665495 RepID=A0ABW4N7A4_9CAUL
MKSWFASSAAVILASASLVAAAGSGTFAADKPAAAAAQPVTVATRRITESQYRHAIANAFGPEIAINARFEPGKREEGLLAIGVTQLSITSGGFEQYYALARSIADQALDPKRRDAVVGCAPADPKKPDAACAERFIQTYGTKLFRRPLSRGDLEARVAVANNGAAKTGDFYEGLKLSLVSLLMAPEYLFRIERAEPDPANPGALRLDGYTKASRISYLLWDAEPDEALLAAAARGDLHTEEGLQRELARMTASPKLADGARAFFEDMLQLSEFENLTKDTLTYPKFSTALAESAKEQTLKTLIHHVVTENGDYREIFTSQDTFINRHLAAVYQVAYASEEPWTRFSFAKEAGRSGILTEVSFLSLFAHPAASSPTKRGVKLYEIFMCEPTPEPPADVDFSKVQALDKGTVRTRLIDHMSNPGCAACHRISDPAGLALEHFDGLGQRRTLENGTLIDVSSEINGRKFEGAQGLGQLLYDDPKTAACLVRNAYAYGTGRAPDEDEDEDYLAAQAKAFAADGYRFRALLTRIGSSPELFKVVVPARPKPAQRVAEARPQRLAGEVR